jgi:hypothetical protein
MDQYTLYSYLCYYDPRNPYFDQDSIPSEPRCFCDNCFYGRTTLALELIRLTNLNKEEPLT